MQIKLYKKFVFRSPLLPKTQKFYSQEFLTALYISSPVLYHEFKKHKNSLNGNPKLINSLYKYLIRATTRCTPFGLFSGIGIGVWKSKSNIILNSKTDSLKISATIDFSLSKRIAEIVESNPSVENLIKYIPNQSIYYLSNSIRYVEVRKNEQADSYHINKIQSNEYLEKLLTEAKSGKTKIQLVTFLCTLGIDFDNCLSYVNELIDANVIFSELQPSTTGEIYFKRILNFLNNINKDILDEELKKIKNILSELDNVFSKSEIHNYFDVNTYKSIYEKIKEIIPELAEKNFLKLDLFKYPIKSELSNNLSSKLLESVNFLIKISKPIENENLKTFKEMFFNRYENSEIPLLFALDPELGVGYPANVSNELNEFVGDFFPKQIEKLEVELSSYQNVLFSLLEKAIKNCQHKLEISDADFKNINYDSNFNFDSISVLFKVLDPNSDKIQVISINNGGVNMISRFTNESKDIEEISKEITEFETVKNKDAILAEIVYPSKNRAGNILQRNNLRKFEIPYLGISNKHESNIIDVQDLYLQMIDNNLLLFDKKSRKRIIPKLSSAHNFYSNELPVYRFLCDFQNDNSISNISFNWDFLYNKFSFLPRIEYKGCILSPAIWRIKSDNILELFETKIDDEKKVKNFQEFIKVNNITEYFLIGDDDNKLLIDSNDVNSITVFIQEVKKNPTITIFESFFDSSTSLITDKNGNIYENECIAFCLNEKQFNFHTTKNLVQNEKAFENFALGSEWLYYKVYCSSYIIDEVINNKLKKIILNLTNNNLINYWFFVRYADPENHLRLRFHIPSTKKLDMIIEIINQEFSDLLVENTIYKMQTDTYKRELKRYGTNSIEIIEKIFSLDSEFVLDSLAILNSKENSFTRWQLAFWSVNQYLDDFDFNLDEKLSFTNKMAISFFNEFNNGKETKIYLDNKYRDLKNQIYFLDKDSKMIINQILKTRMINSKSLITLLKQLKNNNELEIPIEELVSSIIHMSLNRIFIGKSRESELVVYHLLYKHYTYLLKRTN